MKTSGFFLVFIFALAIGQAFLPANIYADDSVVLVIQPKKCVAMRKGQRCYQKLTVTFRAFESQNYCLHIENDPMPAKCWANSFDGKFTYLLDSDKSVEFFLYRQNGELVARSEVVVAWVYSNQRRKRSTWRLF